MTMSADEIRWIRQEIATQLNIILSAQAGDNAAVQTEDIENLLQNNPTIPKRPVMHPYGYASRAPRGVFSIVAKMGEGPSNRFVLGHRDGDRPTDLQLGETRVYSLAGYTVRWNDSGVFLSHGDSTPEPMVLGTAANEFLGMLLDLIANHTHAGQGAPPSNTLQFTQAKADTIDTKKLLATKEGGF